MTKEIGPDFDPLRAACAMVESTNEILGGTPVIRGTRVPVHDVGAWAAAGTPIDDILRHYPSLTPEQVRLSRLYADVFPAPPRVPNALPPGAGTLVDKKARSRS